MAAKPTGLSLQTILDNQTTGILWLDAAQRLTYLNPAAETLLKLDARQVLHGGRHFVAADVPLPSEEDGIDFEGEVGIIVDRVPMGTRAAQAGAHLKLLVLLNDWSLRVLAGKDIKTGFGVMQSKPATSFAPVAVTPDELGDAWRDGRVRLPIRVYWNGNEFGHPDCSTMGFSFEQLIEHAARTRNLSAGTIIGSGTISNPDYRTVGSACIAERRGIELVDHGKPRTDYMKFGDRVRMEMLDAGGNSIFGAIDQRVVPAKAP